MSFNKRIDEARQAFAERNLEASQRAHTPRAIRQARERHGGAGPLYIGDLVYGGLGSGAILILGLANLLADGLSMATGAYLSSKSEREYYERERAREAWEVEHFLDGERAEMLEIYADQGYSAQEAQALVEIQSRDPERFVDTMMIQELGLLPDERKPLLSAQATFGAFVVAGTLPLLVYVLGLVVAINPAASFPTATILSGLALFGLGAAKVRITERNWLRSGLEMLVVGGLAAAVAYLVGFLLQGLGG
jgi:VIT1/CCC1 family predicted Fe2+/Mn2+ transporter